MNLENIDTEKWIELATTYGLRIIGAIAIWIIGSWIIKKVLKTTRKIMTKSDYDESLQKFLLNLFNWSLKILLIITLLGTIGVPTTSFAAVIAAAGLAIGLALQGSLGNFAGGVLIMIFKPFKIGDLIEAQGEIGSVKKIEIFTTKLTGLSNKEIIIPNGALSNGNIINYTTEGTRRVDLVFGVGYDSDIKKTKDVLLKVLTSHPKILQTPEPTVNVLELADSSINFAVRPWCNAADYWSVYFEVTENTKEALDAAGIEIPYPHQVEIRKNA
jgi:small conductance mechanosensitive channel